MLKKSDITFIQVPPVFYERRCHSCLFGFYKFEPFSFLQLLIYTIDHYLNFSRQSGSRETPSRTNQTEGCDFAEKCCSGDAHQGYA